MNFDHYTNAPVSLGVDLVNTAGWVSGEDEIVTVSDLERFLDESARDWVDDLPAVKPADLAPVRALRTDLRRVFEAGDAETAAAALNDILAANGAAPRLSTHGGPPHLHFEPTNATLARWLAVVTAMGLVIVLADHGLDRLGVCQSETCDDVFVDTSRNRSRRHCSTTCGVRENVAAHRERQRQGS